MALPEIEIVEDDNIWSKTKIPVLRDSKCPNCDQKIKRELDGKGGTRIPPHNRKVFRNFKNGRPEYKLEACPGGKI